MQHGYEHRTIESKWQKKWMKEKAFEARDDQSEPKYYPLIEFPYPSGAGLHVGHPRPYIALDIIARKRRREGYNVLYPIGWDAFGLPTENYAIKTGRHPRDITKKNTDTFRRQIQSLGISFDWSREINTTDPKYYKWTQWIFLQLYKKGLAYKAKTLISWCPKCKIGLANEEVVDGACERCGHAPVEKREKEQWMLAITKYAQRLYDDLDTVDYIERAKTQQRNWIGPSQGALLPFKLTTGETLEVFTTRPDTLFGATYMVLAPEHEIISALETQITNWDEILQYIEVSQKKTDIERTSEGREKTGVKLEGVKAINPGTKEEIPIFVADYVLVHYGTGAIMAVPAHDERDFAFAKKFDVSVQQVIESEETPYAGDGQLINSGDFSGLHSTEAKKKIVHAIGGKPLTTYKLRDWIFSRQRYWGEPIPMIHCAKCEWVAVPEDQLPIVLPEVEKYEPTDSGESPLAAMDEWVSTTCSKCGGPAKRETDTMPNWGGSSWYYLRYTDPENDTEFASQDKLKYWTPVDWYNGGMEHTVLHLLYSRFWHKFLFDEGLVPTSEPYQKRTSHGLILAEGGEKMSKSKGNVVNPDDIIERFGADALRVYEMFMGPFDQAIAWSINGLVGVRRFLERVVRLEESVQEMDNPELDVLLNQTIKKVGDDIEQMKFNTAVSQLMIFVNEAEKGIGQAQFKTFLMLLAPFAPHLAEELWEQAGNSKTIHSEPWPLYDEQKLQDDKITLAVQVNGKVRAELTTSRAATEKEVTVQARPMVKQWLRGNEPKRTIYVPGKLVNFVV